MKLNEWMSLPEYEVHNREYDILYDWKEYHDKAIETINRLQSNVIELIKRQSTQETTFEAWMAANPLNDEYFSRADMRWYAEQAFKAGMASGKDFYITHAKEDWEKTFGPGKTIRTVQGALTPGNGKED